MSAKVPTLSANGWLSAVPEKADALIAYYFTTEKSQSYIYSDHIASLTFHVQNFGNDPIKLEDRMQTALIDMFNRYFDQVDFTIRVVDSEDEPGKRNIILEGEIIDGDARYDLSRSIVTENNRVTKIFSLNNNGE